MFGDDESVFDRLWNRFCSKFDFLVPLRIINRPESLTILDYRPTSVSFLALGVLVMVTAIAGYLVLAGAADALTLSLSALAGAACLFFFFRGTIREAYYFDKTNDKYALVRQFIHRKEVIEGPLSQFSSAYVKTERSEESECHYVVLRQEGMFLTGVNEQTLREEVPMFNSFAREARIASAIMCFLPPKS